MKAPEVAYYVSALADEDGFCGPEDGIALLALDRKAVEACRVVTEEALAVPWTSPLSLAEAREAVTALPCRIAGPRSSFAPAVVDAVRRSMDNAGHRMVWLEPEAAVGLRGRGTAGGTVDPGEFGLLWEWPRADGGPLETGQLWTLWLLHLALLMGTAKDIRRVALDIARSRPYTLIEFLDNGVGWPMEDAGRRGEGRPSLDLHEVIGRRELKPLLASDDAWLRERALEAVGRGGRGR